MQAHAPLQAATRALVHWLASLPEVRLSWEHISAHTGHPWNEAADAAAWAAVSEWILPSDFALLENLLAADSTSIDWIWMLERSQQPIYAPFPPVHDGLMRLNASAVLDHVPSAGKHPFHRHLDSEQCASATTDFTLRIATANVLTLYQNKSAHGKHVTARLEALLRDFSSEGCHMIGVQESRSQFTGHNICLDYHILASPASSRGVGGVQLWIKKHWTVPHGRINCLPICALLLQDHSI